MKLIFDEEVAVEKGDVLEIDFDWFDLTYSIKINGVIIKVKDQDETSK